MRKLLARFKKLYADREKYDDLSRKAQMELATVGADLRKALGTKLNALKGEEDSPLKSYKWVGQFQSVFETPGVQILGLVLSAKCQKNRPDPIETFLGEALPVVRCGYALPLQKGVTLRAVHKGWEIRFSDRYAQDHSDYMTAEQCRQYITEHKLRATMSSPEHGDYNRAKQFIAQCDEFMTTLGKEKK
jgi:hypothetical protein